MTTLLRPVSTGAYRKSPADFKGVTRNPRVVAARGGAEHKGEMAGFEHPFGSRRRGGSERTRTRLTHPDPSLLSPRSTDPPSARTRGKAYGFASFGNPLICWENPWNCLEKAWIFL